MLAVAPPDDDTIRHHLDDVLSRPEFHPEENFWVQLVKLINRFFGWLNGLGDSSPALFWLLLTGLVIVLILLVSHIAWSVVKVLRLPGHISPEDDLKGRRGRLSSACREEAARHAAAGNFTEAIRFLFLALVYRFDESGRVSFQKAYTNREYLTHFGDRPSLYRDLKVFVDTLDDNWYGQRSTERERYENCLALYESLR
jgi:hypothetical protein